MTRRTWLVTGANRGLGLEWTRQLVARGEGVIATARERSAELDRLGARVETLDVADASSVSRLAESLDGLALDVLVNNAGRGGAGATLDKLDWADVAATFEVNAIGPMRMTQALLPNLRAGSRKLVAHVTSRMGSIADNSSGGYYAYRASKAALNMMNKSLSIDLARGGFTCVVLHPGWVQTDMGGAGAPLTPRESVAGMLAVLDGLGPSDTGRFLDHDGQTIPW
jgi:NAD(P)-dependent dehydrogenase (short-subunit alcohol dehydrogenase family)